MHFVIQFKSKCLTSGLVTVTLSIIATCWIISIIDITIYVNSLTHPSGIDQLTYHRSNHRNELLQIYPRISLTGVNTRCPLTEALDIIFT